MVASIQQLIEGNQLYLTLYIPMRVSAGVLKFLPDPIPTLVSRNHEGIEVLYVPRSTIFKDGGFTDVYFCVITIDSNPFCTGLAHRARCMV